MPGRLFVVKSSGQLVRVESVNDSYVSIAVLTDPPMWWNMPRAQYEADFAENYRVPTVEDLAGQETEIELPANAPPDWRRNVLTDSVPGG